MRFEGIKVEKKYEYTPMIEAHSTELQQVFLNLVINAVQAMTGRGYGSRIEHSVSDNPQYGGCVFPSKKNTCW
jgi:signal transduction histidine kinase